MSKTEEIDYSNLPDYMQKSARAYIEDGRPFGHFMTELFSNRLVQAFGRADENNTAAMRDWASFLYNEAPSECWGSPEKVKAWIESGGLRGQRGESKDGRM